MAESISTEPCRMRSGARMRRGGKMKRWNRMSWLAMGRTGETRRGGESAGACSHIL